MPDIQKLLQFFLSSRPFETDILKEWDQAVFRIVICVIAVSYLLYQLFSANHPSSLIQMTSLVIAYVICSIVIFYSITVYKKHYLARRLIAITIDIIIPLSCLFLFGEVAAPLSAVLLWACIDNGGRYGWRYLIPIVMVSVAGLLVLLTMSLYGGQHPSLIFSYIVSIIFIPASVLILIEGLKKEKQSAEIASQKKSQFLSDMNQELKTPLMSIIGMGELLALESLGRKYQDQINSMNRSARVALHLMDDMQNISHNGVSKLKVRSAELNIFDLIYSLSLVHRPQIQAKNIKFSLSVDSDIPKILTGDSLRIRQVLSHFLSKAQAFSRKGDIALSVKKLKESKDVVHLIFTVAFSDVAGLGNTNKQYAPQDNLSIQDMENSGFSLSISKQLIDSMGGNIGFGYTGDGRFKLWFELPMPSIVNKKSVRQQAPLAGNQALLLSSDNAFIYRMNGMLCRWDLGVESVSTVVDAIIQLKSGGSEFQNYQLLIVDGRNLEIKPEQFCKLKKTDSALDKLPAILIDQSAGSDIRDIIHQGFSSVIGSEFSETIFFNTVHSVIAATRLEPNSKVLPLHENANGNLDQLSPKHILLAEDNEMLRILLFSILEKAGHNLVLVDNEEQILDVLLEKDDFDLVILDMQMPNVSSFDVIRSYRYSEISSDNKLPFIVLSDNELASARQEAEDAGASAYLTKPVDSSSLISMVNEFSVSDKTRSLVKKRKAVNKNTQGKTVKKQVLSEHILNDFIEYTEDSSIAVLLMERYFSGAEQSLITLKQAYDSQQYELLRDTAHGLQGSSASVGAEIVQELCKTLSYATSDMLDNQSGQIITDIEIQLKSVLLAYQKYNKKQNSSGIIDFPHRK